MKPKDTEINFDQQPSVVLLPMFFVLIMWLVFWAEHQFHFDLLYLAIYPRTISGLFGIIFSPFLHGNIEHLYNNTIPIFVLMAALRLFYHKDSYLIIGLGIVLSGALTWIFARENYHIGASSLIYVLASFIFFKGMQTKHYQLVALSFLVVLLYGSMIWYIFPGVEEGISWEGHLSGLIVGLFFTKIFNVLPYNKTYKYDWEKPDFDATKDKFMQRFDGNGNFVNIPKVDETWEYYTSNLNVVYELKKDAIN